MAKIYYGSVLSTGELDTTNFTKFTIDNDISIKVIRTMIICYNSPTLIGLKGKIYSDRNGAPGALIATSTNDFDLADLTTYDYAVRDIYFTFTPQHLKGGISYHLVLSADSYTGNDNSHIAWVKAFPDPVYDVTGSRSALEMKNIATWPHYVSIIGANL